MTSVSSPVIEFVGLCGAGKSTLHAGLMPLLSQSGTAFDLRQPSSVPGALALPAGLSCAAGMIRHGGAGFLASPAHWWLPMKLGYRRAQHRLNAVAADSWRIEMDTGLLQPIVSFAAEYNTKLAHIPVRAVMAVIDLPRIAVHVVSTPELALGRYLARDAGRLAGVDRRQLAAQFAQAAEILDDLVKASRRQGVQVVDIPAEDNRNSAMVADLAARMLKIISEGKLDG